MRQEMPRSMWPWTLSESGFAPNKSRKRSDAIVAIKKHPRVIISGRDD